jgi:hypothetical protein
MKSFILGFSCSLIGIFAIKESLFIPVKSSKLSSTVQTTKIDLFKSNTSPVIMTKSPLFVDIKKTSLSDNTDSFAQNNHSVPDTNGAEDDEILSINIEDTIPIEFDSSNLPSYSAQITQDEDENLVASLPTTIENKDIIADNSTSPWVAVKSSKRPPKNQKILEDFEDAPSLPLTDNFIQNSEQNEALSYKVAKKIKQSIIFPIPNEILSDEDLTPTFAPKQSVQKQSSSQKTKQVPSVKEDDFHIIKKQEPSAQEETKDANDGILNSLTSWLTNSKETKTSEDTRPVQTTPPAYTSQRATTQTLNNLTFSAKKENRSDFAAFYKDLQEVSQEYEGRPITPKELTLFFQPDRAEISGQTLRWLKAFAEQTKTGQYYLQIRLSASTPSDLQKRRLNLLYTIFMNNGVNPESVDTVFSLTEQNSFIIRTLAVK